MKAHGKPTQPGEKRNLAEEAMDFACEESFDNYCITGEPGRKSYADFNALMAKGGNLSIESMGT